MVVFPLKLAGKFREEKDGCWWEKSFAHEDLFRGKAIKINFGIDLKRSKIYEKSHKKQPERMGRACWSEGEGWVRAGVEYAGGSWAGRRGAG